jgi:peptidoglycan hydrolase-like protein with peptidoglycan-binding domain
MNWIVALVVLGVLGYFTLINGSPSTVPAAATLPATTTGPMTVAQMQAKLAELGYQPGPVDGVMGNRSIDALKRFQKDHNLPVTGTLDEQTTSRLRVRMR